MVVVMLVLISHVVVDDDVAAVDAVMDFWSVDLSIVSLMFKCQWKNTCLPENLPLPTVLNLLLLYMYSVTLLYS